MDLPPGFHFKPTDKELINDYLRPLVKGESPACPGVILQAELYGAQADISKIFEDGSRASRFYDEDEDVLYFYTSLTKKFNKESARISRTAGSGTWTGQDGGTEIKDREEEVIGWVKSFSYTERSNKRKKTSPFKVSWIMHEYSLADYSSSTDQNGKEHVICRIRRKITGKCSSTEHSSSSSTNLVDVDEIQLPTADDMTTARMRMIGDNKIAQYGPSCSFEMGSSSSHPVEYSKEEFAQSAHAMNYYAPLASWNGTEYRRFERGSSSSNPVNYSKDVMIGNEMLQHEMEVMAMPSAQSTVCNGPTTTTAAFNTPTSTTSNDNGFEMTDEELQCHMDELLNYDFEF